MLVSGEDEGERGRGEMKTYVMTSFSRDCCSKNFVSCITSGILDRAIRKKKSSCQHLPFFMLSKVQKKLTLRQKLLHNLRRLLKHLLQIPPHLPHHLHHPRHLRALSDLSEAQSPRPPLEKSRVLGCYFLDHFHEAGVFTERVAVELAHVWTVGGWGGGGCTSDG